MDINKLKESDSFLKAIIDSMSCPIFIIDPSNRIESINNSFIKLFDRNDTEPTGSLTGNAICCAYLKNGEECGSTAHCLSCVLRESITDAITKDIFAEKKYFEKEFYINGKVVKKSLKLTINPLKYQNGNYFICVFDDITDEFKLEEKLLAQNEKMKLEMLMARGIQAELLPKKNRIGNLHFSYLYRPCETLGGDFLSFYSINKRYSGIIIADVSGHGLVPSMFTVFLFSIIDKTLKSPKKILENIFYEFSKFNVEPEMYITMMCGVFDRHTNKITFSNAGFPNYPAISRKNGIDIIEVKGMPISNWFDEVDYEEITVEFVKGERLVMFSDGISEIERGHDADSEKEYLYGILSDKKKSGNEAIRFALHDIRTQTEAKIRDDITVLIVDNLKSGYTE